jgi:aspartate/methionine/tyrosine aminotransferase
MIIPAAERLSSVQEYYFSRKLSEVRELMKQGRDIINLGIGNPDLPPSAETIDRLCEAANPESAHGYQPYRGTPELRRAMADWYQRTYEVTLNSESEILPLLGSKEGIFHISMAFLNPGDRALVPDPGYPAYASVTRLAGGEPLFYNLRESSNWLPDLDALTGGNLTGVKLMWINYPHMPTGKTANRENFQRIIQFAQEKGILICHDNPYSLILNPGKPLSILALEGAAETCLELNSLSKSHNMAGWRVGMVCGRREFLDAILIVKSNMDSGMFLPVQQAAAQALQNSEAWHAERNRLYYQRRELVYQLVKAIGLSYETGGAGMFVWAKLPDTIPDAESFVDELLYSRGIFVTPGSIFGKNGERYIRVSVCAPEERIQKAINRVLNIPEESL